MRLGCGRLEIARPSDGLLACAVVEAINAFVIADVVSASRV